MEAMNVELAGEFLLMAATLTQIKSRMLLPSMGDEDEKRGRRSPLMAIVRPLLEHMKIRDAAEALERRDILNRDVFARQVPMEELEFDPVDEDLVEANLFDLIDAFRKIATHFEEETGLKFVLETKTIQERITEIIRLLKERKQATFEDLCETDKTKAQLVLTFLSILELARIGCLRIYQHQITRSITLFYVDTVPLTPVRSLNISPETETDLDGEFEDGELEE